jgi:hypothetical protein
MRSCAKKGIDISPGQRPAMLRHSAMAAVGFALCLLTWAGAAGAQSPQAAPAAGAPECVPACLSRAGYVCVNGECVLPAFPPSGQSASTSASDEDDRFGRVFQLAIRTGAQLPFGQTTGNGPGSDKMTETFSWQVPLIVEMGWKATPNLVVGLYGSVGFGGASGMVANACAENNVSCIAVSWQLGLEALYHFAPGATISPWLGYGIGYESNTMNESGVGGSASLTASGWEFGHFMAGVDFPLSKKVAIGPLLDFSLGEYTSLTSSTAVTGQFGAQIPTGSSGGDIAHTAFHEWLLIGGRIVFFP